MNWFANLFLSRKIAARPAPIRKDVRLQIDRLEERWVPSLTITTTSLPNWTLNFAGYSQTIATNGSTGTETFSVSVGAAPAGLTLNTSTGAITGTPTAAGASSFTIKVADTAGDTATQAYTVTINPAITLTPPVLADWTANKSGYSQTVKVGHGDGTGTDTFSVSAGTLPAGLSLNTSSGAITGTPTTAGASKFTITATDSIGATGATPYTVNISPAIVLTPTTLANWTINKSGYSATVSVVSGDGTGADSFSVSTGALPTGLSLDTTTGAITGTPSVAAVSSFTITATDSVGAAGAQAYAVTINPAIAVTPATLTNWTANLAGYSQTIKASGGTGADTFSVSTGTLPTGLSLNKTTGAITGAPTKIGADTFTITATDSVGAASSQAYTVTISPPIIFTPLTLAPLYVKQPYSESITTIGGTAAVTLSYTLSGTLPAGLSINFPPSTKHAGPLTIKGTPRSDDYATITITAIDSIGAETVVTYALPTPRRRGGD
jgi:large repetitive protein